MVFSSEREAELIEENMPKIYRAVDNFKARCDQSKGVPIPYEDCVQEVVLVFLQYIRRCQTEEQISLFPWYDAMHALSEYVLRCQPLSVPIRTSSFRSIIQSVPRTVSYDLLLTGGIDVDGMSKHWVPDKNTELDFDAFMSEQDESVQRLTSMRLYGMTLRDIAGQFGISFQGVNKRIKKLRKEYDKFKEEDDDE